MLKVRTSCPTRVDIAGGTLDLWPLYHQLEKKATVNLALELRAEVELEESSDGLFHFISEDLNQERSGSFHELRKDQTLKLHGLFLGALWRENLPALTLRTRARSPKGAGLGGSSSLAVALCAALTRGRGELGDPVSQEEDHLVSVAMDIESSLIRSPAGCQDHWAAMRGGLNLMSYPFGKVQVKTLDPTLLESSEIALLPVYSGQSRDSSLNNWSVYQSFFSGDEKTIRVLERIGELAEGCASAFEAQDILGAIEFSRKEWALRRELWPDIVTEATERVDALAIKHGALFTRVCGAGGGGVMCVFISREKKGALIEALKGDGLRVLDAPFSRDGLRVGES